MSQNDHDISTLNELITTTIDSADGYDEAAREAQNSRFAALFSQRASERRAMVTRLQNEVSLLGGQPEQSGSMMAGAERLFFNLKSAVMNHNEKMIINEVEAGEDHIKAKYEDAMVDNRLSPQVKAIIEDGFRHVLEGHDEMRDIKHAMQR